MARCSGAAAFGTRRQRHALQGRGGVSLRILLTGRNGQVGWALERLLPALGETIATDRRTLDLGDPQALRRSIRELGPAMIVNAAAYTAVDAAESAPDLAGQINALAPGVMAEEARRCGALLVHYSTDYVFDGDKPGAYSESDPPNPINAYGRTKLEGEQAIQASGCRHLILRTSWIYSERGSNFLLTILRLARAQGSLRVVSDQVGAPTAAHAVAGATVEMLRAKGPEGTFHLAAAGSTSWHGFAQAIVECAGLRIAVLPVDSHQQARAARRPRNSRLDCGKLAAAYGIALPHWKTPLAAVVKRLPG